MSSKQGVVGSIVSLWRYPVKSMLGEELNSVEMTPGGLLGDRAYGLIDSSDGKVATAKNPRKWPGLFGFHAALGATAAPVRITLPDGTVVSSEQPDIHQILSKALQREVRLESAAHSSPAGVSEQYWPDMDGRDHRDTVTDFELPAGTFFDCAVVNLLTTSTLARLRELYPQGRFEIPRFRPNIVVETNGGEKDFVENSWIGQTVEIGDAVRLRITAPCGRCVMTTLAQGDLPQDAGILRTLVRHNKAQVGVYAAVLQAGTVRRRDTVRLV